MLEENVFKTRFKKKLEMSFLKAISWFLLSNWIITFVITLSERIFWDYDVQQIKLSFNLRHKNRLTIYCYKSRFHWIFRGIFGIKNEKSFLILTSSFKNWWVRKNSNLRPSLYQSDILTNWTTDPYFTFWFQAIVLLIPESSKRDIQTVVFGWPLSCKWFSL